VIMTSVVPALIVTHDVEEAEELGDTIISYSEGRVTGTRKVEHVAHGQPPHLGPSDTEPA
jgi:ABC-type molybdate transport system ATPase subunit